MKLSFFTNEPTCILDSEMAEVIDDEYDAIIIGSGPSGSSAAFFLADYLDRILLIDKEKFPREKLCGGAISNKSIEYLVSKWDLKKKIPHSE